MKKFLILLLVAGLFGFTSCSDDDDNNDEQTTDPIIGVWVLTEVNPAFINPDACDDDSILTLNADNSGSGTFYLEGNNCEAQTSTGSWENKGGSVYTIELPFAGSGQQEGTANFNGNVFSFTTNFTVEGFSIPVVLTFQKQ